MSMTQLVLGCALGFIVAQGLMYGLRRLIGAKARGKRATTAAAGPEPDEKSVPLSYVRAFIRYAAPVFASAAFVLLGAWTLQDYLSAKSARAAVLEVPDPVVVPEPQALSPAAASPMPARPRRRRRIRTPITSSRFRAGRAAPA